MDFTSTDRFRLDALSKPQDHPRPTIPYSQFPRPSLPSLATSFNSQARQKGVEQVPDTLRSALSTHSFEPDLNMDPGTPSGHRRRRSSLMNNYDGGPQTRRLRSQRVKDGTSDEPSRADDDHRASSEILSSGSDELEMGSLSEEEGLNDDEETGLTGEARTHRTNRKKRNTLLDQRIAGDSKNITREERNEANQSMIKSLAINALLIGLWYLFSLCLSIYNKWMFSTQHLDFNFPLFTTSVHMLVQFSLACTVLYFFPRFRPRYNSISNQHNIHATDADRARHKEEEKKPLMTRWFYCTRLGPCGMATGLDIGLGNMSMKYISLSFYTMCKSSSLAFVLMFAFLFRLETPSWRLVAIIATMTVGVVMMVFGEVNYSAIGFILVISAAFFSGFRWGLTQILLLRNPATSNPFSSIFYLAPIMFATLFTLAIPVEGFPALFSRLQLLVQDKGLLLGPAIILVPGIIAFLMTASEFALLQRTSVVTLSIAGIFKEVITIAAAGLIFDDHLTPINISGLFVTIGAIAAYNYIKFTKMREDTLGKVHASYAAVPGNGGSEDGQGDEEEWEMQETRSAGLGNGAVLKGDEKVDATAGDLLGVGTAGRS